MSTVTTTVQHRPLAGTTFTTLSDVQTLTLNNGRQKLSDGIRPGNAYIEGRRPDLLPAIAIGDIIKITIANNGFTAIWQHRVADAQINYGITSAEDTWSLDTEDGLAVIGRASYSATWAVESNARVRAAELMDACGSFMDGFTSLTSAPVSTATFDEALAGDVLQKLVNTEQGLVYGSGLSGSKLGVMWNNLGWQYGLPQYYLSDDGVGTSPGTYQTLVFRSMADNYADKVSATNDVLIETSGSGVFSFMVPTFSPTAADLQNIAEFVRQVYSLQNQKPSEISVLLNSQTNNTAAKLMMTPAPTEIITRFRGGVYYSIPIGITITADPSSCRLRLYLMDSDAFRFLVLDDPSFGRLDYNKLGF